MSASDDDDMLLGLGQAAPAEGEAPVDADQVHDAPASNASESSGSDSDDDAAPAADDDQVDADALLAAVEGDDADAPGDAAAPAAESPFAHITDKKEAKKTLSKADYKLWKKALGKDKKKKSKKDKKKGKPSKKDKKKNKDKKGGKASKKQRKNGSDDEYASSGEGSGSDEENAGGRGGRKKRAAAQRAQQSFAFEGADLNARLAQQQPKKKKPTAASTLQAQHTNCAELVEAMELARLADAEARRLGQPPLRRIQLIGKVRDAANRLHLHETLVKCGFLKELGAWLVAGDELAPEDLRTAALDALELIPFEDAEGGKRVATKKKHGDDVDDVDLYDGASKEDLRATNLGYAANKLRQHPKETPRNRAKATYLLQRLSFAFNGGSEGLPNDSKLWQSQGRADILPPFAHVKSASEKFAEKQSRVDPTDPKSYLRVAPKRFQPSYVSGIFDYSTQKRDD